MCRKKQTANALKKDKILPSKKKKIAKEVEQAPHVMKEITKEVKEDKTTKKGKVVKWSLEKQVKEAQIPKLACQNPYLLY